MQRADCIWLIIMVAAALGRLASGECRTLLSLVIQNGQSWFMPSSCCYLFMYAPIAYAPAKLGRSSSDRHKTGEFAFPDMKKLSEWEKLRPTLSILTEM
jgi:hypothetical protein